MTEKILGNLIVAPLFKAAATLEELPLLDPAQKNVTASDRIVRDAAIQRFEYCLELSWKTLKRLLEKKGVSVVSPRDVFREAARNGLVDDPAVWFDYLEKRNLTSHTYNEEVAAEVYAAVPPFRDSLRALLRIIERM